MKTGRDILIGGVTLFPMMSKEEKEKDQNHEDRGSNPKERYYFPLMSKGEINMRRKISGALVIDGV
jgi:hypothetical protein